MYNNDFDDREPLQPHSLEFYLHLGGHCVPIQLWCSCIGRVINKQWRVIEEAIIVTLDRMLGFSENHSCLCKQTKSKREMSIFKMKASVGKEVINLHQMGEVRPSCDNSTSLLHFVYLLFVFFLSWEIYLALGEGLPLEHPTATRSRTIGFLSSANQKHTH